MIATSGFRTALECIEFVVGGAPPRTPLGELTALPQARSWFKGSYF